MTDGQCAGSYEATVLQQLALNGRSKRVLEIGIFTGTSTASRRPFLRNARSRSRAKNIISRHSQLALALLPLVDKVVGLELEGFMEEFDRPFWEQAGVSGKIETKIGPALDALAELAATGTEPFDFGTSAPGQAIATAFPGHG